MNAGRRTAGLIGAVVVAQAVLAGCGNGGNGTDTVIRAGEVKLEGEQLVAAAKEEGELSFYCASAPDTCKALADGFQEKYQGTRVVVLRVTSPDLSARYASEKKARAKTADVLLHSDIPFIAVGLKEGLITSFGKAGYLPGDFPKEWVVSTGEITGTPFISEGIGIGVNTEVVPQSERPTSWQDITDPKWRGKMTGPDKTNAGFAPMYGTTADHVPGLLEGLSKQEIFGDTGGMVSLTESLGAGQYAIQTLASPVTIAAAKQKGAPVDVVYPKEGVTGPAFAYTLNPEPAKPHLQKLFAQYVASKDAGERLSKINDALAAAYIDLKFTFNPPNFEYYTEAGKKKIIDAMAGN
ncbi:ABC transporter substrate-binding protein [Microbispora sp. H13382]|uniref:ABC transporter substrate-binding protein n=1 Tax=Microbispora sp. H13382 TaxID=2729112 RepID=UPI00160065A4|nr:extracellular solute-binding protein [Microbispora sp. H13382]